MSAHKTALDWQPVSTMQDLQQQAYWLALVRDFFSQRKLLEVVTPYLSTHTVTDPHCHSWHVQSENALGDTMYLHTSPEYAMKRLLASGSGSIYQIAKVFRADELGTWHAHEFLMLEWYRVGWDHQQLLDEVLLLLQQIVGEKPVIRCTYAQLFARYLDISVHDATVPMLKEVVQSCGIFLSDALLAQDALSLWLDLCFTHCLVPKLPADHIIAYDAFPVAQAALARRVDSDEGPVAARFEVMINGVECANGFYELNDACEQADRFDQDLLWRKAQGLVCPEKDPYLLAALPNLPDCSGVSIGLDRVFALAAGKKGLSTF